MDPLRVDRRRRVDWEFQTWTCSTEHTWALYGQLKSENNSTLGDQVGTIAGTSEPAVPGPLSENETPRPERLGTG